MQNEWTLNTLTMGNISKEDPCRIHSELDGVDGWLLMGTLSIPVLGMAGGGGYGAL